MHNKIIRLIDRTRTVTDWKCPRARFWGYEFEGRGVVKNGTSLELFMGITVHDALAAIAHSHLNDKGVDIDKLAQTAYDQMFNNLMDGADQTQDAVEFAKEQATLTEGMIRGYYKHVWPQILEQYPNIVCVEQEMEYKLADGFVFMTKPDLIVEDKEGELTYIEYKTTSSKKEGWVNSWQTAVQLHSSIMATEASLGKRPSAVRILGLYKGYESYGKQSSPFCYAYKKAGNPPFTQDQISYEYRAGFRRYPTWELEGGVKGWIATMPPNVLTDQFPMTAPIFVDEDLVGSFFKQRLHREQEVADSKEWMKEHPEDVEHIMNAVFPQRFDQCIPSFGKGCQYRQLCHGRSDHPLKEGYVLREPHHDLEREQMGLDLIEENIGAE